MDLKKLFNNNNKAVSPVIGVVLMVAITVILAAAIGSSVFGQGPAKAAPQANINAKIINGDTLIIEHLGGDTLVLANTNIRFTREDGSIEDLDDTVVEDNGIIDYINLENLDEDAQFSVGDIMSITVTDVEDGLPTGKVFDLKITDKVTNQLICDKNLRT